MQDQMLASLHVTRDFVYHAWDAVGVTTTTDVMVGGGLPSPTWLVTNEMSVTTSGLGEVVPVADPELPPCDCVPLGEAVVVAVPLLPLMVLPLDVTVAVLPPPIPSRRAAMASLAAALCPADDA